MKKITVFTNTYLYTNLTQQPHVASQIIFECTFWVIWKNIFHHLLFVLSHMRNLYQLIMYEHISKDMSHNEIQLYAYFFSSYLLMKSGVMDLFSSVRGMHPNNIFRDPIVKGKNNFSPLWFITFKGEF